MRMPVGLEDGIGLCGDQYMSEIPRQQVCRMAAQLLKLSERIVFHSVTVSNMRLWRSGYMNIPSLYDIMSELFVFMALFVFFYNEFDKMRLLIQSRETSTTRIKHHILLLRLNII